MYPQHKEPKPGLESRTSCCEATVISTKLIVGTPQSARGPLSPQTTQTSSNKFMYRHNVNLVYNASAHMTDVIVCMKQVKQWSTNWIF